jgi:hypothetical protein
MAEYPKWRHHADDASVLVMTPDQERDLAPDGAGWGNLKRDLLEKKAPGPTGSPAGKGLSTVNPNSGSPAQKGLMVALVGQHTHFVQGKTSANFGPGIAVTAVDVHAPTFATAVMDIGAGATGVKTVTVTTGEEVVTLPNGFTVAGTKISTD